MYVKIPCKRCLVRDMQDEGMKKSVADYINSLDENEKVAPDVAEERLLVCNDCKWLSYGTCKKTGSIVDAAVFCRTQECPLDFWKKS